MPWLYNLETEPDSDGDLAADCGDETCYITRDDCHAIAKAFGYELTPIGEK